MLDMPTDQEVLLIFLSEHEKLNIAKFVFSGAILLSSLRLK
jgi:hypothetical protein